MKNPSAEPFSDPTFSHLTLVGKSVTGAVGNGLLLRRGTRGKIHNALIVGLPRFGLDIEGDQTAIHAGNGTLGIFNSIFANTNNFAEGDADKDKGLIESTWALDTKLGNRTEDLAKIAFGSVAITAIDLKQTAGSPALTGSKSPDDIFFDKVDFIGACGTDCSEFAGWTAFPDK
ncbi:MAG: hypothetical protein RMJ98_06570 [Myxococcales bacterium]|nr:hypothetical protein [Polyangiaceae bacterium]MDW8248949.1 hypothetical protein [Myxococcales bacterium]